MKDDKQATLAKCGKCYRYSRVNKEGRCRRCAPPTVGAVHLSHSTLGQCERIIGLSCEDESLIPEREDGTVIPPREWADIDMQVRHFYETAPPELIATWNRHVAVINYRGHSTSYGRAVGTFGFVYLLRSAKGYHKIGRAVDVQSRVRGLQREFPVEIKLVHFFACEDAVLEEGNLHDRFAKKRLGDTEWFRLDSDDVAAICGMVGAAEPPISVRPLPGPATEEAPIT